MSKVINKSSREYISSNPVRSSIGAIGYGAVNTIELGVEIVGTMRTANRIIDKQLRNFEAELDSEFKATQLAEA